MLCVALAERQTAPEQADSCHGYRSLYPAWSPLKPADCWLTCVLTGPRPGARKRQSKTAIGPNSAADGGCGVASVPSDDGTAHVQRGYAAHTSAGVDRCTPSVTQTPVMYRAFVIREDTTGNQPPVYKPWSLSSTSA